MTSIDQVRQCCHIVKEVKPQRTPEPVREFSSKIKGPTASISSHQRTPLLALSLHVRMNSSVLNVKVEDRESQEGEQANDIL